MNRLGKTVSSALAVLLLAAAVGLPVSRQARANVDFRVLLQQHFDAHNRGDVAAVMNTLSDDVFMATPGLCFAAPCVGKASVQREIENRISLHANLTLVSLTESSGVGSGRLRVTADNIRACNVERIFVNFDAEVKNDRISRYTARPDVTDGPTAAYFACVSGASVRPPSTGDAGLR